MKRLLILLCFIFSLKASAVCLNKTDYEIKVKANPAKYVTNLSREEFLRRSNQAVNPNTLGLTTVSFNVSVEGEPYAERDGKATCVGLKKVILTFGYDDLTIYIDKKYKPGSCQYKVIKEHEEYHASVAKEAVPFFKPDIRKQLIKVLSQLKPERVFTSQAGNDVIVRQTNKVMQDMQPLIKHINKVIVDKNYQIDTPESYKKTTALCKKWSRGTCFFFTKYFF